MFVLVPILSPESQATMAPLLIESEGQVKQATEQLHIAKLDARPGREPRRRPRPRRRRLLVDAKAQYDLAQTNLRAAEARRESLAKVGVRRQGGVAEGRRSSRPPRASCRTSTPRSARRSPPARRCSRSSGSTRSGSGCRSTSATLRRLATDRPAAVGGLADAPGAPGERPAKPVVAPPSGDPLAATVNVFYEVANADGRFRPGERVGVTLPLKGEDESLTVPRSALIRDIHGGAWVYEKVKPHAYARRRVLVDRVVGDLAVLASGPKPGAKVVTVGAAELLRRRVRRASEGLTRRPWRRQRDVPGHERRRGDTPEAARCPARVTRRPVVLRTPGAAVAVPAVFRTKVWYRRSW